MRNAVSAANAASSAPGSGSGSVSGSSGSTDMTIPIIAGGIVLLGLLAGGLLFLLARRRRVPEPEAEAEAQ